MAEAPESYDTVAREVIERSIGHTFEEADSVPRRDIFLRDATDVLAQFVAARSGTPGFHSARFFDAVVALAAMRERIKDAARRSDAVGRLIEAQKKISVLEQRLHERDEQMAALAAKADSEPMAKALAAAEARLAKLEEELAEAQHVVAEHTASDSERLAAMPDPGRTQRLPALDDDAFFEQAAAAFEGTASGRLRAAEVAQAKAAASAALPGEPSPTRKDSSPARPGDSSETDRELDLVVLERDALRAQLEQIVDREKTVRAERNQLKSERDELAARSSELDSGRATQVERERDDALRARTVIDTAKKTLEQELALARVEIQSMKQVVAERDTNRSRSTGALEDALARARDLEESVRREMRSTSRVRRDLDEIRADRDRLRSAVAELALLRDVHRELLSSLGVAQDLEPRKVLDELARRRELVFVHESPSWDVSARGLEHVRDHAPASAAVEAKVRLARQATAHARYETLRGGAGGARGSATELLELARIVAAHEEDLRWVAAIEALVASG